MIGKRIDQLEARLQPAGGVAVIEIPDEMPEPDREAMVSDWRAGRPVDGVLHDLPRRKRPNAFVVLLRRIVAAGRDGLPENPPPRPVLPPEDPQT